MRSEFGAKGDGVSDDTAAFQRALNGLGDKMSTLFVPAGTYRIAHTLQLKKNIYVNVIGADPRTTKIVWSDDAEALPMLQIDGVAYSRFDRLTFDGRNKASVAIDQSYSGQGGNFDTGNQYADVFFTNVEIGFRCGNKGHGCAETAMLRNRFVGNTVAGISMKNFNALDLFVWDSAFIDNRVGATNHPGAGNFHIYQSIFERSKLADIVIGNTGLFNFRWNYSSDSRRFIQTGFTNNPALITVSGNQIFDTTDPASISIVNLGPMILLDNVVRSRAQGDDPIVRGSGTQTDIFSLGNVFTHSGSLATRGHRHAISDVIKPPADVVPHAPGLAPIPEAIATGVFEVSAKARGADIQRVIDDAVRSHWDYPVVHIPSGDYRIDATIIVPANRKIEIVGDGGTSRLIWEGREHGPVLLLSGPSQAILKEFLVEGRQGQADGILITNADQRGGMVFMESPFLRSSRTNLQVDGLAQTRVELHDFEHSGARNKAGQAVSINVIGANDVSSQDAVPAETVIFGGASSNNDVSYGLSHGGRLSISDIWYEGEGRTIANITGNGSFLYAGSQLYLPKCPEGAAIVFNEFHGEAALLNLNTNCNVRTEADSAGGRIAAIGLVSGQPESLQNRSQPPTQAIVLVGQTTSSPPFARGSTPLPESGVVETSLLESILAHARESRPVRVNPLPAGLTDVRMYRVFVDNADVGVRLTAAEPYGPR